MNASVSASRKGDRVRISVTVGGKSYPVHLTPDGGDKLALLILAAGAEIRQEKACQKQPTK